MPAIAPVWVCVCDREHTSKQGGNQQTWAEAGRAIRARLAQSKQNLPVHKHISAPSAKEQFWERGLLGL